MNVAFAVRELISECYDQALNGLERSIAEKNAKRKEYWLERIIHLMSELNWIDKRILKLQATADD
jgi:hypothetical protein